MLAQTIAWAEVNSGTGNLAGLARMADLLCDALSVLPGEVRRIAPAPVEAMGVDGRLREVAHGDHLLLEVRPAAPLQLLLTGHMDTVYAADHPFQAVTLRDDGTLHGPGTADMKGGLAAMIAALAVVEASPAREAVGYRVLVNSDEETGSFSSAALLAEAARGRHFAFTYEPALPDGTLAGARGGTGNFSIAVRGRAAHAGRDPHAGRNALVAAADLALRLNAAAAPDLFVNPARIDGGGPNNIVPDLAVLRVNFRPADPSAIARASAAIDAAAAEVATAHDVRVEVHGGFNRPPKPVDPGAERLFGHVAAAGTDLGIALARRATGGVCDGNNIAAAGVPVIDTMGVRGGLIHSDGEFLITESLAERAALSAVTILRLAERGSL